MNKLVGLCVLAIMITLAACGMSSMEIGEQVGKNHKPQLGLEMDFK